MHRGCKWRVRSLTVDPGVPDTLLEERRAGKEDAIGVLVFGRDPVRAARRLSKALAVGANLERGKGGRREEGEWVRTGAQRGMLRMSSGAAGWRRCVCLREGEGSEGE